MSLPESMPIHQWVFRARLGKVVDGDTQDYFIDLGLRGYRVERMRLLGIDAPEVRGIEREAGKAATIWVADWLARGMAEATVEQREWPFVLRTLKDPDAFGRWLARVWRVSDGQELGPAMLLAGQATVWTR